MRLEKQECVGSSTEVVDLDRDGGEGQPLIVARTYDDATLRLLLAAPGLVEACEAVVSARDTAPPILLMQYTSQAYQAIEACRAALAAAKGTT